MKRRIILALAVVAGISTANAQFGLGKIKDKLTKKDESSTTSSSGSTSTSTSSSSSASSSGNKKTKLPDPPSSELHKKYMNKMVFAHTMAAVEKGKEKEAEFITSFRVGERLYVRNYFDNSLANYLQPSGMNLEKSLWFQYFIYLDGVITDTINTESMSEDHQKYNWTTFRDAISTTDKPELNQYVSARAFDGFLTRNLDKLLTGKHTLKFELVPYNYETKVFLAPAATGEISVEGPADLLNSGYCFNKQTVSNPAVSAELLKTANKGSKGVKVTKVLLLDEDWREIRGQATGTVLRKEIDAVNIGTENNGTTCYYQYVLYAKNLYPAKGEDPNYIKSMERGESMPCSCMKVIK